MCEHRDHRFRVTVTPSGGTPQDVVFQAKGLVDAVAQADVWAHTVYGDVAVTIETHRMGYGSDESARAHQGVRPRLSRCYSPCKTGCSTQE